MSGIVGLLNLDGAPVDRQLLQEMTEFLSYCGPDAQAVRSVGSVGFGHAMLRTTPESATERQPATLDGEVWITADARVDDRAELVHKLRSKGCECSESSPDAELILQAYSAWGEECVEHLLGDFAFAIWDGCRRRLFCARDHFGVKPFYYAQAGDSLVFSNTLECVRRHPGVSNELNDQAIADFLLFGHNHDLLTTPFADIQRLPPAHFLTWSRGELGTRRYWILPVEGPIRYGRAGEYVEHFRELLRAAVQDRLRTDRVGIFLSGGLDSSSVAATAKELLLRHGASFDLRAYTQVFEKLFPHEEGYYAKLVAEALGIPIHPLVADDYALFERWDQPELQTPEPTDFPLLAIDADQARQVSHHSRVALWGNGGDPLFHAQCWPYIVGLLRSFQWGRLVWEVGGYMLARGRIPPPLAGFRTRLRRLLGLRVEQPEYPCWLNRELEARLSLPARWKRWQESLLDTVSPHPTRPGAYEDLLRPIWSHSFESGDAGATRFPVEVRYPFFDVRLVRYLLALPPVPWCVDKELVRVAMRGVLPEPVRRRPKTPLPTDPTLAVLRRSRSDAVDYFKPTPALLRYVERNRIAPVSGETDDLRLGVNLRPLCLNYWLQSVSPVAYKPPQEGNDVGGPVEGTKETVRQTGVARVR